MISHLTHSSSSFRLLAENTVGFIQHMELRGHRDRIRNCWVHVARLNRSPQDVGYLAYLLDLKEKREAGGNLVSLNLFRVSPIPIHRSPQASWQLSHIHSYIHPLVLGGNLKFTFRLCQLHKTLHTEQKSRNMFR